MMRRAALAGAAVLGATRAAAYLGDGPSRLPGGLELITTYLPMQAWAIAWATVAVLAVASVPAPRLERYAWGALVGMLLAWSLAYVFGWVEALLAGESSREWLNASTYGGAAWVVAALVADRDHKREQDADG